MLMLNADENRKIWLKTIEENKALLNGRVKSDIEKYRKGYCKLHITDSNGIPIKNKKIKINQISHNFGFGANMLMLDEFESESDNATYRSEFKKYFNLATIPFYWHGLEPEQGKPRYSKSSPKVYRRPAPELCMEYCNENNIKAKLHCLVYDTYIPKWLPINDMNAMEKLYEERFRQISERFTGRFIELEVINELLCEHFWNYKSVISSKRDIIEWAFGLAKKYFPNEMLLINESNPIIGLAENDYRDAYFLMLENALKSGVKIDKIGLQHHIFTGVSTKTPEEYETSVKRGSPMVEIDKILKGLDIISELGLPLEITEVTVPTFGNTEEDEELQADLLEILYTVWFSHPAMNNIVYWNVPDGYAHDNGSGWNENNCRGGLWHHDLTPKRSALRLKKLIDELWHTDEELVTDDGGFAEFRGFYGSYNVCIENFTKEFMLRKNENPVINLKI